MYDFGSTEKMNRKESDFCLLLLPKDDTEDYIEIDLFMLIPTGVHLLDFFEWMAFDVYSIRSGIM